MHPRRGDGWRQKGVRARPDACWPARWPYVTTPPRPRSCQQLNRAAALHLFVGRTDLTTGSGLFSSAWMRLVMLALSALSPPSKEEASCRDAAQENQQARPEDTGRGRFGQHRRKGERPSGEPEPLRTSKQGAPCCDSVSSRRERPGVHTCQTYRGTGWNSRPSFLFLSDCSPLGILASRKRPPP